jgi:hypothetical protein
MCSHRLSGPTLSIRLPGFSEGNCFAFTVRPFETTASRRGTDDLLINCRLQLTTPMLRARVADYFHYPCFFKLSEWLKGCESRIRGRISIVSMERMCSLSFRWDRSNEFLQVRGRLPAKDSVLHWFRREDPSYDRRGIFCETSFECAVGKDGMATFRQRLSRLLTTLNRLHE